MATKTVRSSTRRWKNNSRLLRAALLTTSFGNGLTGVALTIAIVKSYAATGASVSLLALSIGMLLSFASGGIHADTSHRVHAIVTSDCIRGIANLAVVIGILIASSYGLLLVAAGCLVNGICAGYFRPALSSLWADLVPAAQLKKTLATNSLLNRISLAVGGAFGGVLIAIDAPTLGIALDSVSFFIAAVMVLFVTEPGRTPATGSTIHGQPQSKRLIHTALTRINVFAQWKALFRAARKSTWFNLWAGSSIAVSFAEGAASVCLPVVLVQNYSNSEVGLFSSVSVVALLLGALCARLITNIPLPGLVATWSSLGNGFSVTAVALGAGAPLATALRFSGYACNALSAPSLSNFIAQQYPPAERGKVYAMQTGASSVLAPIGMLAASLLLPFVQATAILTVFASVGCALAVLPLIKRDTWHMAINN